MKVIIKRRLGEMGIGELEEYVRELQTIYDVKRLFDCRKGDKPKLIKAIFEKKVADAWLELEDTDDTFYCIVQELKRETEPIRKAQLEAQIDMIMYEFMCDELNLTVEDPGLFDK